MAMLTSLFTSSTVSWKKVEGRIGVPLNTSWRVNYVRKAHEVMFSCYVSVNAGNGRGRRDSMGCYLLIEIIKKLTKTSIQFTFLGKRSQSFVMQV